LDGKRFTLDIPRLFVLPDKQTNIIR